MSRAMRGSSALHVLAYQELKGMSPTVLEVYDRVTELNRMYRFEFNAQELKLITYALYYRITRTDGGTK